MSKSKLNTFHCSHNPPDLMAVLSELIRHLSVPREKDSAVDEVVVAAVTVVAEEVVDMEDIREEVKEAETPGTLVDRAVVVMEVVKVVVAMEEVRESFQSTRSFSRKQSNTHN